MADENKNNSINSHYKHKKLADNPLRTGGEFHVDSASYPRVMSGGYVSVYLSVIHHSYMAELFDTQS